MEYLHGELYSLSTIMEMDDHTLDLLMSGWQDADKCVYVDFGYRKRVPLGREAYLVQWEPDGTARWEPLDPADSLAQDWNGRKIFKMASYLQSRGYKCTCRNDLSLKDLRRGCGCTPDILLTRNGDICREWEWFDYSAYRWYVNYHRRGLLAVDGWDVRRLCTNGCRP